MFSVNDLHGLAEILRDPNIASESESDQESYKKYKTSKAGENPLFKAVITSNRGATGGAALDCTGNTTPQTTTSTTQPQQHQVEDAEEEEEELDPEAAAAARAARRERRRRAAATAAAREGQAAAAAYSATAAAAAAATKVRSDPKAVWAEEEVPFGQIHGFDEDSDDESGNSKSNGGAATKRREPEYEIVYKQKVTAEDLFLNMGMKNTSSMSCEDIIVKVTLPDTVYKTIDLNVTDTKLQVTTPVFKLALHLPHIVISDSGSAKWDAKRGVLSITLPIKPESD